MNIDQAVMALAGTLVLLSPWWLLLPAFVGANLLQASITGLCPAAVALRRLGVSAGCALR
ncbi:YgaP-like transmembrane domain [Aeromicrobium sp.]|uniref:YgaP-like transmembrane domain n=1 Tax=Aeromicrobium sp. TaxID=1871063 RepID=UPI003519D616